MYKAYLTVPTYIFLNVQGCDDVSGGESIYGVCFVDTSIGKFHVSKTVYQNGLFQKKSLPPPQTDGVVFNPPLSPGFPEAQNPPPVWVSKTKDSPSHLDFQEKILGLSLIYL